MAGDWIKMRGNLWDDPRVGALVDATESSEAAIVGGLYWLWSTADQHTEDGVMPGMTLRQIERKTGIKGFGAALVDVGWVADHPEGIRIVKFEEHNGASAKRRCTDAQRKANGRSLSASEADTERTESGQKSPNLGAREREEKEEEKREEKGESRKRSIPCPEDVDAQVWADWTALRQQKKAKVSATAVEGARAEAAKAGLTLEQFLRIWCTRGSQGLEAKWLRPDERAAVIGAETAYQRSMRERVTAFAPGVARGTTLSSLVVEDANVTAIASR